nr:GIY-YIG nuclease family protein [Paenibacillus sp. ACRRX]
MSPIDIRKKKYLFDSCDTGIYVIYDMEGLVMYVGKSKHLRNRLLAHLRGRDVTNGHADKIVKVRVYFVEDRLERELYETYAINTLKPWLNSAKVYHDEALVHIEEEIAETELVIRDLEEERAMIIGDDYTKDGEYGHFDNSQVYLYSEETRKLAELESEIKENKTKLTRLKAVS